MSSSICPRIWNLDGRLRGETVIGAGSTATMSSVPSTLRPGTSFWKDSELGAVHIMIFAPPRAWSASAWSTFDPSMYSYAPSSRESASFEGPEESAMTRKPIAFAIWMARWPRPLYNMCVQNRARSLERR